MQSLKDEMVDTKCKLSDILVTDVVFFGSLIPDSELFDKESLAILVFKLLSDCWTLWCPLEPNFASLRPFVLDTFPAAYGPTRWNTTRDTFNVMISY